ncbi:hypothetical protein SPI_07974 [Niveomyces insectorum RCEF 264]|uniref:Uncharacterized protein n=1 Tax=Niveomyces insectorum RCEF 264 TaxID=1081102 RepID=A0A167P746_9HYPO|nr:hypothetical protein SPI_07974 [Niveomyces insectorum RCEF 264]
MPPQPRLAAGPRCVSKPKSFLHPNASSSKTKSFHIASFTCSTTTTDTFTPAFFASCTIDAQSSMGLIFQHPADGDPSWDAPSFRRPAHPFAAPDVDPTAGDLYPPPSARRSRHDHGRRRAPPIDRAACRWSAVPAAGHSPSHSHSHGHGHGHTTRDTARPQRTHRPRRAHATAHGVHGPAWYRAVVLRWAVERHRVDCRGADDRTAHSQRTPSPFPPPPFENRRRTPAPNPYHRPPSLERQGAFRAASTTKTAWPSTVAAVVPDGRCCAWIVSMTDWVASRSNGDKDDGI